MSWKQRREHRPEPTSVEAGYQDACIHCGDLITKVKLVSQDPSRPVLEQRVEKSYWRHHRRWMVKPQEV